MEDKKERILNSKTSMIYVFRSKETGEYVDNAGNPTEDIFEAVGYLTYSKALEALDTFDEPDMWYIVTKITNISIIGEPIEVTNFI